MDDNKHTVSDIWDIKLKTEKDEGLLALSIGCLFLLAYIESLIVAYLFFRKHPVVFPLSRPPRGHYFCEYFILLKTSLKPSSSFDHLLRGRIYMQLQGEFGDSPQLELKKGRGTEHFLTRGVINIFVYHSPYDLGQIQNIKFELINDAPYEIPYIEWRPCFVSIMRPATDEHWGCTVTKRIQSKEFAEAEFPCTTGLGDRRSILKTILQYHNWFSLFNRAVRFGMYSNIVNTIMIYFTLMSIGCLALIYQYIVSASDTQEAFSGISRHLLNPYAAAATISCVAAIFTFLFEVILRNCTPKFCQSLKTYTGLSESIKSPYILRDFFINYNWDEVKPLISRDTIIIIKGSQHGYAQSIFPITKPNSVHNLWGFYSPEEQREWSIFMRSMNSASLPLPLSMRWLSKEAWSNIEQLMMTIHQSDYKATSCFFHVWLQDWPLNYAYEPQQAGMIVSNIICRNLVALIRRPDDDTRSRLARLCLFQWYGLIAFIFLRIIMQEADRRNEPTLNIKAFIYRVIDQYSYRSPAEIQMSWQKRKEYLRIVGTGQYTLGDLADGHSLLTDRIGEEEDENYLNFLLNEKEKEEEDWDDLNMSAYPLAKASEKVNNLPGFSPDHIVSPNTSSINFENRNDEISKICSSNNTIKHIGSGEVNKNNKKQSLQELSKNKNYELGDCPGIYKEENENQERSWRRRRNNPQNPITTFQKSCKDKQHDEAYKKLKDFYLNMNNSAKRSASNYGTRPYKDRDECPMAHFETVDVGRPYDPDVMPLIKNSDDYCFYRHRDEISGFCCQQDKCAGYLEIHQKVGHSALEILKKLLHQLLYYAMDSRFNRLQRSKCWLRKKMVKTLYEAMRKKAGLYDNSMFKLVEGVTERRYELGFISNELLTANYTALYVLLDVSNINRQVCKLLRERESAEALRRNEEKIKAKMGRLSLIPYTGPKKFPRPIRCLFCAKKVKGSDASNSSGCYNMEKLVKFFSTETCIVAEKEINMEFQSKHSIQNYCAMIVNIAKKELLIELEDPPLVLSAKVSRAVIYQLLDECLPKHTNVKDMSIEELRRVGTRRQRIQARHDTSMGARLKESFDQKRRKALVQSLIDEFTVKWRMSVKENTLSYCTTLLSQCLVQERILGLPIYSGYISKDHELLLNNSKDRLNEVEEKAYNAIIQISRSLYEPLLKQLLDSGDDIDVLFTKQKAENSYFCEAVSVMQVCNVPTFLKTTCYYIDDIVTVKVKEFKEFMGYVKKNMTPSKLTFSETDKEMFQSLTKGEKYKIELPLEFKEEIQHMSIASPILRWGNRVIKGEPPVPAKLRPDDDAAKEETFDKTLDEILAKNFGEPVKELIVSNMVKARKSARNYLDSKQKENNKELQTYLAKVQARLTDQIAIASQSMADAYVIDTDFQRDYLPEELFNVEYFCTRKMNVIFPTLFGIFLCFAIFCVSCSATIISILLASNIASSDLSAWLKVTGISIGIYAFAFEPLKCIIYAIAQVFQDSF